MPAVADLEAYLKSAEVESVSGWPLRGSHPSYLVVLVGGIGTIGKPEDQAPAPGSSRREVAAWILARDLGWPDLVATSIFRKLPSQGNPGTQTDWSLQVVWPANERGPSLDRFADGDVVRAAIFDALVVHGDRHGANYLAVPPVASGVQPRLKLVDHGSAFTAADTASPFYLARRGQELPDECHRAIEGCLAKYPGDLKPLLEQGELDALLARLERLRDTRKVILA
jgi:hypothetical protein